MTNQDVRNIMSQIENKLLEAQRELAVRPEIGPEIRPLMMQLLAIRQWALRLLRKSNEG